jgi:acyl carrier protein
VASDNLQTIIGIVQATGKISGVAAEDDFYDAGFSSINALQLLLELESAFDVTIPDDEFVVARTCRSLESLVSRLSQATK